MSGRAPQFEASRADGRGRPSPRTVAAIAAAIAAFEGGAPRRVRVAPIRERAEERAPAAAATPSLWALSGRLAQMAARRELWAKRRG